MFCNWRNSFGIHGFFCCFFHLNVSIKSPKCFCIHGSFQFSNTWIIISQEKICEKLFFTALSIDTSTAMLRIVHRKTFEQAWILLNFNLRCAAYNIMGQFYVRTDINWWVNWYLSIDSNGELARKSEICVLLLNYGNVCFMLHLQSSKSFACY